MKACVSLCRICLLLLLSFLAGCSRLFPDKEEEITQNFYYNPAASSRFEEFRYEWVATDTVLPWQFYYGLVYWRFNSGDRTGFALPYFLVKNTKGQDYPHRFTLSSAGGMTWRFIRLGESSDFELPYRTPAPIVVKAGSALPTKAGPIQLRTRPPFTGQVYIMDLSQGEPLDWSALRTVYEEATKGTNSFHLEWENDLNDPSARITEPDRTIFSFNLEETGIQTFMETLKRWGIS